MPATYTFNIDWDGSGDFGGTGENVTSRVFEQSGLSTRYGRDRARAWAPMAAGEAAFELNNRSRDYSPDNSSSPLFGNVLPGREVYVKATLSAVDYGLFRGHIDDFDILPDVDRRLVSMSCLDPVARLREIRISTPMFRGIRTGAALHAILDEAEWPADKRDIDYGVTSIPWYWLYDQDVFTAAQELVDSEGPPALLTVDADGNIVFRDRHHRLLRPASLTSQATFRDIGAEPLFSAPAVYDHGLRDIANSVKFTVPVYVPDSQASVVWSSTAKMSIDEGETRQVTVKASVPFINAIVPEAGTDFTLVSGTVTVTISPDSGEQTTISIAAVGGPAVVSGLQLRAVELAVDSTYVVQAREANSIGKYGRRNWPSDRDPVWASLYDADAIADIIIGHYSERLPTITISMHSSTRDSRTDTRLLQQLSRDLSDRVHIVEAQTGLDHDCFIETIEHNVANTLHTTRFGCEKAPDTVGNVFTFDVAGKGFDDGLFGLIGQSDPDTMFMFDTAGQGFNDGVWAY